MMNHLDRKTVYRYLTIVLLLAALPGTALAGIADSQIGTGIKNMLSDTSAFLVILCPIAAACAAVYFFIRKSMADEQDGKFWQKRIITAVVCGVAGMLVSGIINVVSGYFI